MPANLPDPCCGALPLHRGVKYLSIGHLVILVGCLIGAVTTVLSMLFLWVIVGGTFGFSLMPVIAIVCLLVSTLLVGLVIAQIVLTVLLFFAAEKKNLKRMKMWFMVTPVLTILSCLFGFVSFTGIGVYNMGVCPLFLYTGYMLYVVYAFMEEVKRQTGVPAFAVMQPATVYGQPSQGTMKQSQYNQASPPAYGGSPSSAPSHQSTREV